MPNRTPAFPHGPSIKWPKVYEALRRIGMDKSKAAAISNAHYNKYRRWGKAGAPGPRSAEEYKEQRGRKARRSRGIPLPKSRQVAKHSSPIHPGTGTDQSVHGPNHPMNRLPGTDWSEFGVRHPSIPDRTPYSDWSPVMEPEEAEEYLTRHGLTDVIYGAHATRRPRDVMNEGFLIEEASRYNGYGEGLYLVPEGADDYYESASNYAENGLSLRVAAGVNNTLVVQTEDPSEETFKAIRAGAGNVGVEFHWDGEGMAPLDHYKIITEWGKIPWDPTWDGERSSNGSIHPTDEYPGLAKVLIDNGYDSLEIEAPYVYPMEWQYGEEDVEYDDPDIHYVRFAEDLLPAPATGGSQVVIFDPQHVVIVGKTEHTRFERDEADLEEMLDFEKVDITDEEIRRVFGPFLQRRRRVAKHASPIHPGTGTDQSVHAKTSTGKYSHLSPEYAAEMDKRDRLTAKYQHQISMGRPFGEARAAFSEEMGRDTYFGNTNGVVVPLPRTLYHVTTDVSGVEAHGLKTRDELGQFTGIGLGGGTSDTISFTDDPATADAILVGMRERHAVLNDPATHIPRLIEEAKAGTGANRSWWGTPEQKGSLALKWESGTFAEHNIDRLLAGEHVWRNTMPQTEAEVLAKFESTTTTHWQENYDPTTIEPVLSTRAGTSDSYYEWEVRYTEAGHVAAIGDFMDEYALYRESAGGPLDPLFISNDDLAFSRRDVSDFAVVRVTTKPGTQGQQMGALKEFRVWTGDVIEEMQVLGKKVAA